MDDNRDEEKRRETFVGALATEYFVLQGAASSTISESSSRSSLYLLSLSSGLVSLGFVLSGSPDAFLPFASAVLPTLFILGGFTVVRLVDTSIENVRAQRGMSRIREYYSTLVPEAQEFFTTSGDRAKDARDMLGVRSERFVLLFTMASTIGMVNAVLGGTGAALVAYGPASLDGGPAIALGIVVALALVITMLVYQHMRFTTAFEDTPRRTRH